MSAIGPGDWVQAVKSWNGKTASYSLVAGAIYQVSAVTPSDLKCAACGVTASEAIKLVGKAEKIKPQEGYCHCFFAPWPPPADAALREEPADDPVSVPA